MSLEEIVKRPYKQVTLELEKNFKIEELKELLKKEGETEIRLVIKDQNKKIYYGLQNPRKFDFNKLKMIKNKEYVKKITV